MVTVYEEYVEEQYKKSVSERCFAKTKVIWDEAKKSFSEDTGFEPCVVNLNSTGQPEFVFALLEGETMDRLLDNSCGVDETSNMDIVVLPIKFQEWYYTEPRYSDEYVRFQLCKELEGYELNKVNRALLV